MNIAVVDSIEVDVLAPSKSFVARAIPVEGGFIAQFSAPGLIPRYIGRSQDNPKIFISAQKAEEEARKAAFEIANSPRKNQARGKNVKIEKLSGPPVAVLIAEAGLTLTLCAHIAGTSIDRVQSWIDGLDFMPHPIRLLLEIFKAHPEIVDMAEDITDRASIEKRPR